MGALSGAGGETRRRSRRVRGRRGLARAGRKGSVGCLGLRAREWGGLGRRRAARLVRTRWHGKGDSGRARRALPTGAPWAMSRRGRGVGGQRPRRLWWGPGERRRPLAGGRGGRVPLIRGHRGAKHRRTDGRPRQGWEGCFRGGGMGRGRVARCRWGSVGRRWRGWRRCAGRRGRRRWPRYRVPSVRSGRGRVLRRAIWHRGGRGLP